jgi:hypothetical protein
MVNLKIKTIAFLGLFLLAEISVPSKAAEIQCNSGNGNEEYKIYRTVLRVISRNWNPGSEEERIAKFSGILAIHNMIDDCEGRDESVPFIGSWALWKNSMNNPLFARVVEELEQYAEPKENQTILSTKKSMPKTDESAGFLERFFRGDFF